MRKEEWKKLILRSIKISIRSTILAVIAVALLKEYGVTAAAVCIAVYFILVCVAVKRRGD